MSSLIPDDQKSLLAGVFIHVHDTFSRPVFVYQDDQVTILSENPEYVSVFGVENQSTSIQRILQKAEFKVRVYYPKNTGSQQRFNADIGDKNALELAVSEGDMRIKCDLAGYEFIKSAKRVEVDGFIYEPLSVSIPVGLFKTDFYQKFYKRLD